MKIKITIPLTRNKSAVDVLSFCALISIYYKLTLYFCEKYIRSNFQVFLFLLWRGFGPVGTLLLSDSISLTITGALAWGWKLNCCFLVNVAYGPENRAGGGCRMAWRGEVVMERRRRKKKKMKWKRLFIVIECCYVKGSRKS